MKRLLCLLVLGTALAQEGGDVDTVLTDIFGTPPPTKTGTDIKAGGVNQETIYEIFGTPPSEGDASSTTPKPPATTVKPVSTTKFSIKPNPPPNPEDKSCAMADGSEGECVPYYLCSANNTVVTDGTGIIDIRVRDGPCVSYLDTCCQTGETRAPDNPITTAAPPTVVEREGCGYRNPDGVGFRITGDNDNEAKFGEFPWMCAIIKIEPVNADDPDGQKLYIYVGGGSLIHPSVVLTAAHYVANKNKVLRVRAGEWDTQTKGEIYPYQERGVQDVKVHQDFNSGSLFYDIAVMFLDKPMDITVPNVALACLPTAGERARSGARCFASGWGKDSFGKEGRYQVILKRVDVPVVDRQTCQSSLRQTRLGKFFQLHTSFMCAGGEPGKDTCKGDGGSPLVCPVEFEKDRYVQNGIVAWGIGCGENGTPGVYVDVANLREWIDNEVIGRGYDPKVYTYVL